jgi:hypothetical protein
MIRVNLLKAKSGSAGRLASPGDFLALISRREVQLGVIFLLLSAGVLGWQLSDFGDSGEGLTSSAGSLDPPAAHGEPEAATSEPEPATSEPSESSSPPGPRAETPARAVSSDAQQAQRAAGTSSPGRLTQIVASEEGDRLRVFVATGSKPAYRSFRLDDPPRWVIDLPGVQVAVERSQRELSVSHPLVRRVRVAQNSLTPLKARVVLDLVGRPEVEMLPQINGLYVIVAPK